MGLGTKNRQKQTAEICKQRLREKYSDKLGLVEEFIVEIEGPPNNCDVTRWGKFTDIRDIKKEMFQRLEAQFVKPPPIALGKILALEPACLHMIVPEAYRDENGHMNVRW